MISLHLDAINRLTPIRHHPSERYVRFMDERETVTAIAQGGRFYLQHPQWSLIPL